MANPRTVAPPPPVATEDEPDEEDSPRSWQSALEWFIIIAGALVVALVVRTFLFGAFYIPSPSMEPTLNIRDRVLVNKLSYKLHDVHRGDIVVFKRPPGEASRIKDLIKRVVAVEGDTVTINDDHVFVNGRQLDEPYTHGLPTAPLALFQHCHDPDLPDTCRVPPHQLLVMGDNRPNSSDGRLFGTFDEDLVVGRAFVRIWPLGAISLL